MFQEHQQRETAVLILSALLNFDNSKNHCFSPMPMKAELVVQELKGLGRDLAGLSKTRWLSQGI